MKSWRRSIGIAAGILMLAGVQNASAQLTTALDFSTSFPFTVGNTTMPAGSYSIRPDDDDPHILLLTGSRADVLFQTEDKPQERIPSKNEVTFDRYGDSYVLKTIQVAGSETGYVTMPVEGERHATKHGVSKEPQHVAAALKSGSSK
jgi:hypothetical protein